MRKLIKKIIISSFLGLVVLFGVSNLTLAADCPNGAKSCALEGMADTNTKAGLTAPADSEVWITTQVGNIIGNILAFVGIVFMGFMLYAGYLWMTAGGDATKTGKAIGIITDTVVGLIIIAAAYLLTQYVGNVILGGI